MSEQQCIDLQKQLHSCVARLHQLMEEERSLIQRHPSPRSHAGELPAEFCTATDMSVQWCRIKFQLLQSKFGYIYSPLLEFLRSSTFYKYYGTLVLGCILS